MINKNYCVTTTCFPIKGFLRTAIYDLPKATYEFVPNAVHDFLRLLSQKSFSQIYRNTTEENKTYLSEYFQYCLEKEYILEIPNEINKKHFPKLNLNFEFPSIISNLVIRVNKDLDFEKIKDILVSLKCFNIQLITDSTFDINKIEQYLDVIKDIGLHSIELIVAYSPGINYELLTNKYKNIAFIFIYSAPVNKFIKRHVLGLQQIFTSKNKFEITHIKSLDFFNVNITLFTESQLHNTYFNRKLFIGDKGEIKNSIESPTEFGNINNLKPPDDILKIINSIEFQKYWFIHKGIIDVCKQCEFRYMCVDNRIPLQRNEKEWYFDTECNYNPYIAKWRGEKGYKTLSECGVTSNQEGFKLNRKKINTINKELWGD
ncbi:MAG: grasp-with-spasm system SPASM domain peptide maturase [Bacteroidia bacterium]|nr:grasp-with-spasm system SPASM domain peptide maturase [Bacteroidia bacterium]